MSSMSGEPGANGGLGTRRMESFSDGVLAIAITLLVLEISVRPPGSELEQVLRAWPSYVAYVVSFASVGGVWLAHTTLSELLDRTDAILLRLNLLLLLFVAFLPFPTRLVADTLRDTGSERVAITVYGFTLLLIRLLLIAMVAYARRARLLVTDDLQSNAQEFSSLRRRFAPTVMAYALTIALGVAAPTAAVVLYFGIAIFVVLPYPRAKQVDH